MNKQGKLIVIAPNELCGLDMEIFSHMANEVKSVIADCMCDLCEYGSGDLYDVEAVILLKRKGGK